MSGLVITRWEKPSEGWLKITVREPQLGMDEAYYWCEHDDVGNHYTSSRTWAWRRWSMAGKPTVKVKPEHACILSSLVMQHEVLCHVGVAMGIEELVHSDKTETAR